MSDSSSIEWTDATWNPVTGCTRVSPGCARCYIERTPPFRMAGRRFARVGNAETTGVQLHPDRLEQPLRWRKPRRVFVCSLADLFHDDVPDEFIARVFRTMGLAPAHTFQVLTKRPERALDFLRDRRWRQMGYSPQMGGRPCFPIIPGEYRVDDIPLPNVWLGVSVENDRWTSRVDVLREIPAAVRFVSAEPLLGPLPSLDMTDIDWIIIGGESGPGARPFHLEHARQIIRARAARVWRNPPALFVKQLGSRPMGRNTLELLVSGGKDGSPVPLALRDRKGGDPDEWPPDLRIREFPERASVAA